MTQFKTEKIEGLEVTFYVLENGMFYAKWEHLGTGLGQDTLKECVDDITQKIIEFKKITPESYEELARALTENLTWFGYEECQLSKEVVETIVGNFLKLKNQKDA